MRLRFVLFAVSLTLDASELVVGHFIGQGHIVANWTSRADLPIDLRISPEGAVSGTIGDAEIAEGRITRNRWPSTMFVHSDYTITASLRGPLLREDGVVRKEFRLHVNPDGSGLRGFGASDGNKSLPGASKESRVRGMKLQITKLMLKQAGP